MSRGKNDNKELMDALEVLEKEKNIEKEALLDAIEESLMNACKNHFGNTENIHVDMDRETGTYDLYMEKEITDDVLDPQIEITMEDAKELTGKNNFSYGDFVRLPIESKNFGRIATQNAKNLILQKIREEERKAVYGEYITKEKEIVPGIVERVVGRNLSVDLGKVNTLLTEKEQVPTEHLQQGDKIKLYIVEVKETPKGPKILVSRTHPEFVKRLFEAEVSEISDGTVEIMNIAREAGNRTKMAVRSNDENVDPIGACVGLNGSRVEAVVNELRGEKIDIINWDENPAILIENALSPAQVICVLADPDVKEASVIVPDYQLSLAIGKEGQNARLAARLTGFKIDIKSETQAIESGELPESYAQLTEAGFSGEESSEGELIVEEEISGDEE